MQSRDLTAQSGRRLKIDPRPYEYDSIAEANLDSAIGEVVPDIETAAWRPIAPTAAARTPQSVGFVDGVQRLELRLSAEGEGFPIPGALVSCAAGAALPSDGDPFRHVRLDRCVIVGKGARPPALRVWAGNGGVEYRPAHNAGEDFESIGRTINDVRAGLEVEVVRELLRDHVELIVVDGRLPEVRGGPVVGLIKTLQNLYISKPEHLDTLVALRSGERSPVFAIERRRSTYYSWFVCLRSPGPFDLALSGLARLEIDDSASRDDAFHIADTTAALLPAYASSPMRDPRAPQNLLPVGQLERELRHRLGDPELLKRLMFKVFSEERPEWNP